MNEDQLKNIIEAALMVSDKPMSINCLLELFQKDVEEIKREEIMAAIQRLQDDYQSRGIELAKVANGYRIQSRAEYADWINRLFDEKPPRYSRALLETLAIIAYRQPLTRAEIEDIRGVSVSTNIIKTLQEREWIRVVGHKDLPGKPELLATTKEFLDYFNLKTLSELPTLAELKELNQLNPDLFASLDSTPDFAAEGQLVTDVDESEDEGDADNDGFLNEGKVVPFSNA
ncbi:MAG: SMC-Scp complex subunit ScpB [Gammaproteobacteria bacterium]|nr:SMC-Scp complex subunit ScpB [Gammaproteobacteria bacterium]NIN61461.1 SMC-Scp complex subunit ScpB [Gammaproteobacteria bacterium]NIO61228.1 SMC-Scp complex subunit ScpB [Gammaproteobacteria bacterium]NIP48838.1 SMC-Scp complex subunit ScpB [Gammaproteobacteria bacterium]NIQ09292.1 SMC-Scp complex subunit ScpB [Gammaproteobacteria bacterium]